MTDYRALEQTVSDLCHDDEWFTHWTETYRPGTANSSKTYAITWLWTRQQWPCADQPRMAHTA